MKPIIAVCLAFTISAVVVMALQPVCVWLNHVDMPGGRKRHGFETPLSGGIAIAVSIIALGASLIPSRAFFGFVFGVCVLLVLGAMDDRKHVPAPIRLAMQTVAVAVGMCVLGGVQLHTLGNLLSSGALDLGGWSIVFTIFAAVGIINAVNMIDGMDGLAGGFAVLLIGVILTLAADGRAVNILLLCLSIGSVLGFLAFNLRTPWQRQARIFLGDAGSLVLGYILVWFAIQGSQGPDAIIDPITAVWLFGLPLCDTVYLMGSRLLRRKSPLAADRYHFHHLLLRYGLTPGWALYAWLLVAALFIGVGVIGSLMSVPDYWMCIGFVGCFAVYCLSCNMLWRKRSYGRAIRLDNGAAK